MGSAVVVGPQLENSHVLSPDETSHGSSSTIEAHPLGVRPSGNAWTAKTNIRSYMGQLSILSDEVLTTFLEWLDPPSLIAVGSTCRALLAFTSNEELWRNILIAEPQRKFSWNGSWKATVLKRPNASRLKVDCSRLFSDTLHRPFLCSQIPLESYQDGILSRNRIARMPNLPYSEFSERWTDVPFILTDVVPQWRVYEEWSEEALTKKFGDIMFRAESVDWPLRTYLDYMKSNTDEAPLYLFDSDFVRKMRLDVGLQGAYSPPECFGNDLFELLQDNRPDSRWLIIGPKRSGSTFHKDPNATSAWNAVIKGSKYWIMFPPTTLPPGVYMSADEGEVTSPLSIGEWLLTFHQAAQRTPGCVEGVCKEGEVLHVPSGWWHLVVNLDSAIAITQNFVPESHLKSAVKFLKDKADQVSGFAKDVIDPHSLFLNKLQQYRPDLLQSLENPRVVKRKWEEVVHENAEHGREEGVFSFGFGGEDETSDEVP